MLHTVKPIIPQRQQAAAAQTRTAVAVLSTKCSSSSTQHQVQQQCCNVAMFSSIGRHLEINSHESRICMISPLTSSSRTSDIKSITCTHPTTYTQHLRTHTLPHHLCTHTAASHTHNTTRTYTHTAASPAVDRASLVLWTPLPTKSRRPALLLCYLQ